MGVALLGLLFRLARQLAARQREGAAAPRAAKQKLVLRLLDDDFLVLFNAGGETITVTAAGATQTATVAPDGTWTVTFPTVPVGTHTVTATQSGDGSTDSIGVTVEVEAATDADATDADATDADATDADATDADRPAADAADDDTHTLFLLPWETLARIEIRGIKRLPEEFL